MIIFTEWLHFSKNNDNNGPKPMQETLQANPPPPNNPNLNNCHKS